MKRPRRRGMQRLALFDLDNTLVDRSAAFRAWAQEFVAGYGLDAAALTWLLETDARTAGPRGPFFDSPGHAGRRLVHLRRSRLPQTPTGNLRHHRAALRNVDSARRLDDRRRSRSRHRRGRRAGLRTIWLQRGSMSWPQSQPGPDGTVASVADAVEVLRQAPG